MINSHIYFFLKLFFVGMWLLWKFILLDFLLLLYSFFPLHSYKLNMHVSLEYPCWGKSIFLLYLTQCTQASISYELKIWIVEIKLYIYKVF